jgi:hypothetical protein
MLAAQSVNNLITNVIQVTRIYENSKTMYGMHARKKKNGRLFKHNFVMTHHSAY